LGVIEELSVFSCQNKTRNVSVDASAMKDFAIILERVNLPFLALRLLLKVLLKYSEIHELM